MGRHFVMHDNFRRSVVVLLVVLLGLFLAPAAVAGPDKVPDQTPNDHPSGKDRSVEPGRSGTQGKAKSDPDELANGGADKPGMAGGFDDDKDGNNGCGNDDDFEDDNNGWCRGRLAVAAAVNEKVVDTDDSMIVTEVQGVTLTRSAAEQAAPAAVLPVRLAPRVATSDLPRTGSDTAALVAFGLLLANLGGMCVVLADRRRVAPLAVRVRR
jgi:hypothetical protein